MEHAPVSPENIDFEKDPQKLVPAVVQDARTGEVLMVAWQNREALEATLETGEATFWSRSRGELWRKGGTSGHVQRVRRGAVDCDADTVLLQVDPAGPACHTGEQTCFHRALSGAEPVEMPLRGLLALEQTLEERRMSPPEGSYVGKLYANEAKRHKKVGEEATELVVASLRGKREEIVSEAADLLFHAMVLLRAHGVSLEDVSRALEGRIGAPRRE